jgi:hypothetical protein
MNKYSHSIVFTLFVVGPSLMSFCAITAVFRLELDRQKRWIFLQAMLDEFTAPGCVVLLRVDACLFAETRSEQDDKGNGMHGLTDACVWLPGMQDRLFY